MLSQRTGKRITAHSTRQLACVGALLKLARQMWILFRNHIQIYWGKQLTFSQIRMNGRLSRLAEHYWTTGRYVLGEELIMDPMVTITGTSAQLATPIVRQIRFKTYCSRQALRTACGFCSVPRAPSQNTEGTPRVAVTRKNSIRTSQITFSQESPK